MPRVTILAFAFAFSLAICPERTASGQFMSIETGDLAGYAALESYAKREAALFAEYFRHRASGEEIRLEPAARKHLEQITGEELLKVASVQFYFASESEPLENAVAFSQIDEILIAGVESFPIGGYRSSEGDARSANVVSTAVCKTAGMGLAHCFVVEVYRYELGKWRLNAVNLQKSKSFPLLSKD